MQFPNPTKLRSVIDKTLKLPNVLAEIVKDYAIVIVVVYRDNGICGLERTLFYESAKGKWLTISSSNPFLKVWTIPQLPLATPLSDLYPLIRRCPPPKWRMTDEPPPPRNWMDYYYND